MTCVVWWLYKNYHRCLDVVLITLKKVFDSYMQWIASMRQSRAVAQVKVPISPSGIRTSEPALE